MKDFSILDGLIKSTMQIPFKDKFKVKRKNEISLVVKKNNHNEFKLNLICCQNYKLNLKNY